MIPFSVPTLTGHESETFQQTLQQKKFCGDGAWTKKCHQWLETSLATPKALLTTSCTHALEMAALLANIQPHDEVILPSFTFVSSANAFVLRGAQLVYVDVNPDTMNMDENQVAEALTSRTKAIVPVHYGGVSCNMDFLLGLQKQRPDIFVIEDAAQGIGASYKGKALGTLGDMGCLSFHETKNLHCGEGGALLVQKKDLALRAEIIREKGTNRSQFIRGQVDKYTWQDLGSSYLCSELNAAFLFPQLDASRKITETRLQKWQRYQTELKGLKGVDFLKAPAESQHNGHIFWMRLPSENLRNQLLDFLKGQGIQGTFHYIPLHLSPAGLRYGKFFGEDRYTTRGAQQLIRLPLFDSLTSEQQSKVIEQVSDFARKHL